MDALWAIQEANRRAPTRDIPEVDAVVEQVKAVTQPDGVHHCGLGHAEILVAIDRAIRKKRRFHVRNANRSKRDAKQVVADEDLAFKLMTQHAAEEPEEEPAFVWPALLLYTDPSLGEPWDGVATQLVLKDLRARRRQLAMRLSTVPDARATRRLAETLLDEDQGLLDDASVATEDWSRFTDPTTVATSLVGSSAHDPAAAAAAARQSSNRSTTGRSRVIIDDDASLTVDLIKGAFDPSTIGSPSTLSGAGSPMF